MTQYPAEGISVDPAPAGYVPDVSATEAVSLFEATDVAKATLGDQLTTITPVTQLVAVTESDPTDADVAPGVMFPAWVLTYQNTVGVSYGMGSVIRGSVCDTVAIYDLSISEWTNLFESCTK